MTQPDPDPTNREQRDMVNPADAIIDSWGVEPEDRGIALESVDRDLRALDAAGYEIVPKVELEGLFNAAKPFSWCEDVQERVATPDEVDSGCELGVFFYDCGECVNCRLAAALQALDKENG